MRQTNPFQSLNNCCLFVFRIDYENICSIFSCSSHTVSRNSVSRIVLILTGPLLEWLIKLHLWAIRIGVSTLSMFLWYFIELLERAYFKTFRMLILFSHLITSLSCCLLCLSCLMLKLKKTLVQRDVGDLVWRSIF